MELSATRITVPEALDTARATAFAEAIEAASAADPPAILVEGKPGLFCRGMAFEALVDDAHDGIEQGDRETGRKDRSGSDTDNIASLSPCLPVQNNDVDAGVAAFGRCLRAIRSARRPVIAIVDGAAMGGGVGIVAAADLVIATKRSTFGLPEALFGLIPAIVLPALHERMSPQKARLMALLGHAHGVETAQKIGLVDLVIDDGQEAIERAIRGATRQLSRPRTAAVAALKAWSGEIGSLSFEEAISRGVTRTQSMLREPGVAAAVRAFLGGGEAPWLD